MIKSASYRYCWVDDLPVQESEVFKAVLRLCGVRAAVKITRRITFDYEALRRKNCEEINQILDIIGYVPPNQRSEAS